MDSRYLQWHAQADMASLHAPPDRPERPGLDALSLHANSPAHQSGLRILVTGGSGFIGSNFLLESVPALPNAQFLNADALTYAAHPLNLVPLASAPNYGFRKCDLRNEEAVKALICDYQPDVVFHFAAESHVDRSIDAPSSFIETNVNGTFHLLEALRHHRPSALLQHISTDEVYGSLGADGTFTENSPYAPSSPYSASKASSDHLVRAYSKTYGLRVRVTNCSNNYGPYQFPEKLIPLMIRHAALSQELPIYGVGKNVRDWLYVTDHVKALWSVFDRGADGETYNIGGNAEVTNLEIVEQICHLVAAELGRTPAELLALIRFVKDRPGHDLRYAIDPSKVQRECGWHPEETLESGLKKTVHWYLSQKEWLAASASNSHEEWLLKNYAERGSSAHDTLGPAFVDGERRTG